MTNTSIGISKTASTAIAPFTSAYQELLRDSSRSLAPAESGALTWLKDLREREAVYWQSEGLPTRRLELWKYTNPAAAFGETQSYLINKQTGGNVLGFQSLEIESANEIVFLNGRFQPALSKLSMVAGLKISTLCEASLSGAQPAVEKFRAVLEAVDGESPSVFAAMNSSFIADGVLIEMAAKAVIEKPVVVKFLTSTAAGASGLMTTPRVIVNAGRESRATVVEYHTGQGGAYFANAVTDLFVDEAAHLTYSKIQNEDLSSTHIGAVRVQVRRDARCETSLFSAGAKLSRQDLGVKLMGSGAEVDLDGLYLVSGQQHVDSATSVDHLVPHTTSRQLYKGVVAGESRAVFNGRVHIHRDAQGSSARQLNNNLLLSRKAEVDSKPELDIDADDVKASHGSTVGRLDPEQIFYLQTRAISETDAVQILARGFAQDVAIRASSPYLKRALEAWVNRAFDILKLATGDV